MSVNIKSTIKSLSSALLAGLLMLSVFSANVTADDIYPDNPDDGIITQNEQQTDLLNESTMTGRQSTRPPLSFTTPQAARSLSEKTMRPRRSPLP